LPKTFAIADVAYVHRVTVGSVDPSNLKSESEIQAQMDKVNECLTRPPKGRIIGIEKNFGIYQVGEHQMALQSMTYHIGFMRKPQWLD
jgi:hypothetical protein